MGEKGYECLRCGWKKKASIITIKTAPQNEAEPVYVMSGLDDAIKVARLCPTCGHSEAYRNITVAIGEHSGVKSDRSVERFKCAKCGYTWIEK
jgi:predicted RNA-binding Zn-ribbon protein involved in translation (DUF1610 family)